MPSPFPGMDPYLESTSWVNFHAQFIAELARQLAPRLRPRYLALVDERFVVAYPDESDAGSPATRPDVGLVETGSVGEIGAQPGAVAAPLQLATEMPEPIPHFSVEIRDRAGRSLVAVVELLSPTNKRGEGRDEYLAKRRRILLSPAHLLEIDLLHQGRRVPMRRPLPPAPYFVLLSRAPTRPISDVWPIALDQPLPTVPVPLLDGDPDVPLDLQAALNTVYDACAYDLAIDYARPPEVPLAPAEAAWVVERLRAAGLRHGPDPHD